MEQRIRSPLDCLSGLLTYYLIFNHLQWSSRFDGARCVHFCVHVLGQLLHGSALVVLREVTVPLHHLKIPVPEQLLDRQDDVPGKKYPMANNFTDTVVGSSGMSN